MPVPHLVSDQLDTTVELSVVLDAELAAAATDVERARSSLKETRDVRAKLGERLKRLRALLARLDADDAELAAKEEAEVRLLNVRRKAQFDIETERGA